MDKTKYDAMVQEWMTVIEENCEEDTELTLRYCKDVINYGSDNGDDGLVAYGYYYSGVVYYVKNDGNRFYDAMTSALSYLSRVEDWELMARCYNFLGISSVSRGNVAIALDYYLSAIGYCRMASADALASMVQINIGVLNIICGRYQDALEYLQIAYDYFSQNPQMDNYDNYMICVYENMAKAYLMQGELVEAKCCFERIYSDHKEYCDEVSMLTVLCTEALYYHIAGNAEKCEKNIAIVHKETTSNMPIMDLFDDYYDYCRMLLERGKETEFWQIIDIMEPMIRTLGIIDLHRRIVALKLRAYKKNHQNAEYLQAAALYFELSERVEIENKAMMNNVLNIRKTLEKVNREKIEVEEKNEVLRKKSETDPLTGLNNRFRLNDYSEEAFQKAIDNNTSLAVEILDLDNFKGYNDCNGHQKGDECLQKIATAIKSMEEFGAFTARYGGDEFILIYENITQDQAVEYASELRKRVMDLEIEHTASKVCPVMTISQGMCWDIPVQGNRMWDYLHAADDMLYRTKQKKRNNFCIGNLTEASDKIIMSYL